mmetsp:Transcript_15799/g.48191  ORF Transcript_15799/g.48191 Transcript_15799/m.48191 type:complete len:362 (-) Transcript_15799:152-1237(-)
MGFGLGFDLERVEAAVRGVRGLHGARGHHDGVVLREERAPEARDVVDDVARELERADGHVKQVVGEARQVVDVLGDLAQRVLVRPHELVGLARRLLRVHGVHDGARHVAHVHGLHEHLAVLHHGREREPRARREVVDERVLRPEHDRRADDGRLRERVLHHVLAHGLGPRPSGLGLGVLVERGDVHEGVGPLLLGDARDGRRNDGVGLFISEVHARRRAVRALRRHHRLRLVLLAHERDHHVRAGHGRTNARLVLAVVERVGRLAEVEHGVEVAVLHLAAAVRQHRDVPLLAQHVAHVAPQEAAGAEHHDALARRRGAPAAAAHGQLLDLAQPPHLPAGAGGGAPQRLPGEHGVVPKRKKG